MQSASRSITLEELSQVTGCKLSGDPECEISSVNDLRSAGREDASFLANPRYRELLSRTKAGVVCVDERTSLVEGRNYLISKDPSRAFQKITELLLGHGLSTGFAGIDGAAVIHPTAEVDPEATVCPYTVIDKDARVGEGTIVYPHVYVGPSASIGKNCIIYPGAVIREDCHLGNRVIVQPGAIIGSCGFGYTLDEEKQRFVKLEQLGRVVIEDDVEIGANTAIDRARFKATTISKGTKIDNLVQIGHNVTIGENNAIVSQTGVAGSAKTGKNVLLGGQSGIVGHVEVADDVHIATRGGVSKSITKPGDYRGGPVMPIAAYNKQKVHLRKIGRYVDRIEALEQRLKELEEKL